jgi:CBS domain-containing protein
MTIVNVGSMPVSALAADNTIRIAAEASLLEVARALVDADVGIVVLGDDNQPVRGVVSERDVVRALAAGRDMATTPGRDVANTELVWCDTAATVAQVAEEMMERYVRHVLVEADGRLVGVVSARDLLGAYASADLSIEE